MTRLDAGSRPHPHSRPAPSPPDGLDDREIGVEGPTLPRRDDPAGAPPPEAASPLRRAAILIVSLDEGLARQVLAQLDRDDVDLVSLEMARLDHVDPSEQRAVLEDFYAQGLRRLKFVFDDVARMDDEEIRASYDDHDAALWALALAGAARPLRAKVIGALGASAADALRRALSGLGPFRLDDAEAAQSELVEKLRRRHDQGRLTLPDPDGQEEILV